MTLEWLALGHAGLGALAIATAWLPTTARAVAVGAAASGGIGLGAALVLARGSDEMWRTAELDPGRAVVAGSAVAAAWFLVGILDRGGGRWEPAAYVGVAASGLVLFAANRWVVPGLLFWACSSVALAVLARRRSGRIRVWITLGISDALLTAALVGHVLEHDSWALPEPLTGWPVGLVAAAAVVRSGALPFAGAWGFDETTGGGVPLMIGGGVVLAAGPALGAHPWVALAALAVGVATAGWFVIRRSPSAASPGAWVVAVMLGVVWAAPGSAGVAGAAAVVGASAAVLLPVVVGRDHVPLGLVLALAGPVAGAAAIAAAAFRGFERALTAETAIGAASWFGITALLPACLGMGILTGVRAGRIGDPGRDSSLWPAAGVLLTTALGMGAAQAAVGFGGALGPPTDVALLGGAAAVVGLGAGAIAWLRAPRVDAGPLWVGERLASSAELRGRWATAALVAAAVLGGAAVGGIGWATIQGLRVGFL